MKKEGHGVFAFRVDASLQIGTGHVMRCLTLADLLQRTGMACHFICRAHPAHLIDLIRQRGHIVHVLPSGSENSDPNGDATLHAKWLGTSQREDAKQTAAVLQQIRPEWLIVDHYALDARWEAIQRAHVARLMAIDDLSDRRHDCDVLLDQNLGRTGENYEDLVPSHCMMLTGPLYALLRPEFSHWRNASLERRRLPGLKSLLISMGGIDQRNATGIVLSALENCVLPDAVQITVIMGSRSPSLAAVLAQTPSMRWATTVKTDVTNMAELMSQADFAIGAAGSTTWERCCLGLPSMVVVLAENQQEIASAVHRCRAAVNLGDPFADKFPDTFATAMNIALQPSELLQSSLCAADLVDGAGAERVLKYLNNNM